MSKIVGGGREGASVVEFACDCLLFGMYEKSATSANLSKDFGPWLLLSAWNMLNTMCVRKHSLSETKG